MTRTTDILLLSLAGLVTCTAESTSKPATELRFVDLQGTIRRPLDLGVDKASVVFFVTHDCPIANALAPEIQAIVDAHQKSPLRFLLVHVDPYITAAAAKDHARDYSLRLPVILDPHHLLVRRLGVTITPEVAVWVDGSLAYRGRINDLFADLGRKRRAPTTHDLRDALQAVLAGEKVSTSHTTAVGCDLPDPLPADAPRTENK